MMLVCGSFLRYLEKISHIITLTSSLSLMHMYTQSYLHRGVSLPHLLGAAVVCAVPVITQWFGARSC